ncbi:AIM24 family protein [Metaclostridioides mangenotii]|uniref:AIM24 family protein n=1 Tax=Metaclostridioides mangenotii TaxID=1540 RepID=UPI0026E92C50|nr:AIM24 family protein [Clostridioides mangenotii]
MDLSKKVRVLESYSDGRSEFEILEYDKLEGATDPLMAMALHFSKEAGLKGRQVKIKLNNSSIKTESGALYYYKGQISSDAKIGGVGGFFKKSISGALTNESAMKPQYTGTGEVYLEPSFKHYMVMELDNDSLVVDKGTFYCCSDTIEVRTFAQKNVSSALLGGEGIFQIELKGSGTVILELYVPKNEIIAYEIKRGEELKVDGNFALARTSGVNFAVTKSDKSLVGSMLNGEGLLNTFTGEGTVWLAPTQPMYQSLSFGFMPGNKSMNNTATNAKNIFGGLGSLID